MSFDEPIEDFQRPDLTAMHRSELEATVVDQAKLIERFRRSIANIVRETEDEGDRIYFGSTNDADELRELDEALTDSGNALFCPWMHGSDLYAEMRELRQKADLVPELLEAADAMMARWPADQHEGSPLRDEADALRVAIAKAKGGATASVERCQCGAEATTSYDGDRYCEPCATYSARRDFEESEMPGGFA